MTARARDTEPAPPANAPGQHSLSARLVALERVAEAARKVASPTCSCNTCRSDALLVLDAALVAYERNET